MRFYGQIQRVSDNDDERMVWGYASTEQRAADGLVITRAALEAALADYMAFANIREMHQLSAVGVAREANVDDDGLYLGAWVQDDDAWDKVKTGVYRGFSIGAKCTARDPGDASIITGIRINEISLVDRPADPGAVFDVFRAADSNEEDDMSTSTKTPTSAEAAEPSVEAKPEAETVARADAPAVPVADDGRTTLERAAEEPADAPAAEGETGEVTEATEATAETADIDEPADDPVARAIAAAEAAQAGLTAAVDHVERASKGEPEVAALPGAEIRRSLCDMSYLAYLLAELCYITRSTAIDAAIEGKDSAVPAALRSAVVELVKAYRTMTDEEMAALLKSVSAETAVEVAVVQLAAAGSDLERAAGHTIGDETGARLQSAIDGLITRGFKPNIDKAVEAITGERDNLLRTVTGLTDQMTAMSGRISAIEAQPLPAKTAGPAAVARAVDKGADAAGEPAAAPGFSDADIKRAFDALPADEKALILTRAALARPHLVTR